MFTQTNFTNIQNIRKIKRMVNTLQTPKHNRNEVIVEIINKPYYFQRNLQCLCKTGNMMKHNVTNITNPKYNRNDVITLINILCQPKVGCYEKQGTSINVAKTRLEQGTRWIRTIYAILRSCCHRYKTVHEFVTVSVKSLQKVFQLHKP